MKATRITALLALLLICGAKALGQEWEWNYSTPERTYSGFIEAHANGLKLAIAYPNPGNNMLNIRTGLKNARVEVYDTNGRLLHSQAITENVTGIDAGGWASETYIWKVYTGVSTGSTTLAETGKWIKE